MRKPPIVQSTWVWQCNKRGRQQLSLNAIVVEKSISLDAGQNSRFSKQDKTADFQNETKQPIFKTRQNSRFEHS